MARLALFFLLPIFMIAAHPINALDMWYSGGYNTGERFDVPFIYLDGPVEYGDEQRLASLLQQHPDVEEIVVGMSPGGSLHAGIAIARLIHERRLHVKLEGPAASAATVISLGSRTQLRFQGDFAIQQGTTLLFHCAYLSGNDYCDERATRRSAELLASFSDWSIDQWMRLLMPTTPATVERVSLWDIIDRSAWECEAEAHLSVVCFNRSAPSSALK
ncbi:hypothetical protein [Pararhodobacter sp. CCB-MM2]|uniref:hypothetical protein n=1 Tax=Pararhodobacter sp. CCB-MM2 TaxID=1786003 RepID=UPI001111F719|nr:hypothetical protein [Pararhodobacter sp. CCB-MM2]